MDQGWKPNVEMSPNCPRCGSSKTKFCYYNNYSLTQPRYFCKSCRRYWTKGGSLRNVPVGGGCRKNRRAKSLRLSSNEVAHSKNVGYGGMNIDSSRHSHGYKGINSDSSSSATSDGSHIDLAVVYANFLNPNQYNKTINTSSGFEMGELGTDPFVNSFDLSSISNTNLDSNNIQLQTIGDNSLLEAPLHDNNQLIYYCGMESSSTHKQQANDQKIQQCTSNNNHNSINYGLPPLPGEEIASHVEILWPNSHLTDHSNHSLTQQQLEILAPEIQDPNALLFGNWSPFDLSSDDTFSRS